MEFVGYKKKKGTASYYTDDIVDPTMFSKSSNHYTHPVGVKEFKGRQPIFILEFKINNILTIASGAKLILEDVDTYETYNVFTEEIFNFFYYIRNGDITVDGDIYKGEFKLEKVGKMYGLKLATEEDKNEISFEIPEEV